MRVSKLDKSLMILIAITLIFAGIALVGLIGKVIELDNQIMNKNLQLSILWQEINSAKEINMEMNNKNSELRGYTNFLESQNKMLMDKNGVTE